MNLPHASFCAGCGQALRGSSPPYGHSPTVSMIPPVQPHAPPHAPSRNLTLVLGGVIVVLLLAGVGMGAYILGSSKRSAPSAATPTPAPAAVEPDKPPLAQPAPSPATTDERDMTAAHSQEFPHALHFHYAHVGGRAIADLRGQLGARDGRHFRLGPNDTLTLEAPEGTQFRSVNSSTSEFDFEVEVHEDNRGSVDYEVDVAYDHPNTAAQWAVVGHGAAHRWAIGHVRVGGQPMRAARYVRIRNVHPERAVEIDGVYVRDLQPCADLTRCRDVNHRLPNAPAANASE